MGNSKVVRKKLIDFFSSHSVKRAESAEGKRTLMDAFGVKDWPELLENRDYTQNYEPMKHLRQELDDSIEGLSGLDQVRSCLALLNDKKESVKSDEFEILATLIRNKSPQCLFASWDQEQKNLYNRVLPMITEWKDFFFSYTSRNLPETNHSFQDILLHSFKESEFLRDKEEVNYVAKLIVRYLNVRNLESFYDQNNIVCGDSIEEKILDYCKSCYTFIQLIEEEVFHLPTGKKNWCHLEFKEFDNWASEAFDNVNRYYFFLLFDKNIVFPENIPIPSPYAKWHDTIEKLEYIPVVDGLSNLELKRKVIELAGEIYKAKREILGAFLGDFI